MDVTTPARDSSPGHDEVRGAAGVTAGGARLAVPGEAPYSRDELRAMATEILSRYTPEQVRQLLHRLMGEPPPYDPRDGGEVTPVALRAVVPMAVAVEDIEDGRYDTDPRIAERMARYLR